MKNQLEEQKALEVYLMDLQQKNKGLANQEANFAATKKPTGEAVTKAIQGLTKAVTFWGKYVTQTGANKKALTKQISLLNT